MSRRFYISSFLVLLHLVCLLYMSFFLGNNIKDISNFIITGIILLIVFMCISINYFTQIMRTEYLKKKIVPHFKINTFDGVTLVGNVAFISEGVFQLNKEIHIESPMVLINRGTLILVQLNNIKNIVSVNYDGVITYSLPEFIERYSLK